MEYVISFADTTDEEEVRVLLMENSLGVSGAVEEHVIVRVNSQVYVAGKLAQTDNGHYHLEVLGVRKDQQQAGWGGLLLDAFTSRPWEYCRPEALSVPESYWVTTVPKGEAFPFYSKHGFHACEFSMLAQSYVEQCAACLDREVCRPMPMVFKGGQNP